MLKLNKEIIILVGIVFIASFLRFFRIEDNLVFHGELGVDYLAVRNIIQGKQTPLLGPPTSHPWLSISPLFYWIFTLVLPIADYHPIAGAYFMAGMGVLAVILAYFVIRYFLGETIGLLSSYLLAISPAWVRLTRNSRFNSISPLLFFPYFYFLVRGINEKDQPVGRQGKYLFWAGFFLGLTFSFFPTVVVLLPATLVLIYIKRKKINTKYLWRGLAGLIIPNIPYIVYNALNRFEMMTKLFLWVPYRILGFLGIYPKNTANLEIIKANFVSLYTFFRESWFPEETNFAALLFWTVFTFFVTYTFVKILRRKDNFWLSILIIFTVTYLGLFLHGNPPKHYYLTMFPIPVILLSQFLKNVSKYKVGLVISALILVTISVQAHKYYFSDKWFYQREDQVNKETSLVPLQLQEMVVDFIAKDANGQDFTLKRVGALDYFERDFAQNYIYLLWIAGNEPVDKASLRYTIYEDTTVLPQNADKIYWIGNIAIMKEENEI